MAGTQLRLRGVVELVIVAVVFGLAGVGCGLFMLWTAPFRESFFWWASRISAAAAAAVIAGGFSWLLFCRRGRYAVWRVALVGLLGGVLCHPIYYLIVPRFDGTRVRLAELPSEWLFSLLVSGGFVITVPAGLIGATLCVLLMRFVRPSLSLGA